MNALTSGVRARVRASGQGGFRDRGKLVDITMIDKWKIATGKVICEDIGQTGSGFFIDNQGLFITNNHVVTRMSVDKSGTILVDYSKEIFVKTDGRTCRALLAVDENSDRPVVYDYAVLRLDVAPTAYFDIADVSGISQGDNVMAIGYPLEFDEPVITAGIISAIISRPSHINALHRIETFLTDTLITYGNSGGPLIRVSDGSVVGITTMPHELRDEARKRLSEYIKLSNIEVDAPTRDLIEFVLKYIHIGFNHAISIKFAMSDPVFESG